MSALKHAVRSDERIPTLPAFMARLLGVYARENYNVADVVSVLRVDPAVTTRLLRMANSPYFGVTRRIHTLHEAVILMGQGVVQGLALGTSLLRPWGSRLAPEPVRNVWVHSYLCALVCRHLARNSEPRADRSDPEALFIAGLLHDIGKILFLGREPEAYAALLAEAADPLEFQGREKALMGEGHDLLGEEALWGWHLPPHVAALAGAHHTGEIRPQWKADLDILLAAHALVAGEATVPLGAPLPAALLDGAQQMLDEHRGAAEEFYKTLIMA